MIELDNIYNMDCLEGMRKMESESIDLTVTSPPYDNLRNYKGYCFDFENIAKELYRLTKQGGVVVWVVGDATIDGSETCTSFKQAIYFNESIGFNLHDTMIYEKENPMPQTGNRYHQCFEYMFVFSKGTPKTFNPITIPTSRRGMSYIKNRGKDGSLIYRKEQRTEETKIGNIFSYKIGGGLSSKDKIAFQHPAIFPELLAADHIRSWSNEGDIVLDPFCGSCTTAKMALTLNRHYIGFEISDEYCKIIEKRLLPLKTQYKLF